MVSAAKEPWRGGGGVGGASHRAGGAELVRECRAWGGGPKGQAKATRGYCLPEKHVIHTVGPICGGGDRGEGEALKQCYLSCLALAKELGAATVAFLAISTGDYCYHLDVATQIAVGTLWQACGEGGPKEITFVCFDEKTKNVYRYALQGRG